jgi:ribosomal protein S17E
MTPFTIATKNIKHLGGTLTKQMKDLFDKNFTSLKKELKKISEDGKTSYAHGLAGLI